MNVEKFTYRFKKQFIYHKFKKEMLNKYLNIGTRKIELKELKQTKCYWPVLIYCALFTLKFHISLIITFSLICTWFLFTLKKLKNIQRKTEIKCKKLEKTKKKIEKKLKTTIRNEKKN